MLAAGPQDREEATGSAYIVSLARGSSIMAAVSCLECGRSDGRATDAAQHRQSVNGSASWIIGYAGVDFDGRNCGDKAAGALCCCCLEHAIRSA